MKTYICRRTLHKADTLQDAQIYFEDLYADLDDAEVEPFTPKHTYISLSGGVESTTMAILYGTNATCIWADTGWEHEEMYKRMEQVEKRLKEIHPNIQFVHIKPNVTCKGEKVDSLEAYIERSKYMPNPRQRYCTGRFKIEPIDDFLSDKDGCELLIGLNADEMDRRTGSHEKLKTIVYRYPLVDDNLDRDDCIAILDAHGLNPKFPPYMSRGGCKGCFFKSIKEYKAMYFFNLLEFENIRDLEERIQDKRQKPFYILKQGLSMRMLGEICQTEIAMFGLDAIKEMYAEVKATQSCGAFCHR